MCDVNTLCKRNNMGILNDLDKHSHLPRDVLTQVFPKNYEKDVNIDHRIPDDRFVLVQDSSIENSDDQCLHQQKHEKIRRHHTEV